MRKLQTHDVFMAMKLVRVANIRDEFEKIQKLASKKGANVNDIGYEFIFGVIEKLSGTEAENAFYELLAGPLEMDANDIKTMDPLELINTIKAMSEVINVEEWSAFFKSVSAFLTK